MEGGAFLGNVFWMAPNPLTNDGHVRRCWESLVIRRCHFERCAFFFKKNARKCVDHPENPSMTKEQRGLCVYCWLKGLNLRAYWESSTQPLLHLLLLLLSHFSRVWLCVTHRWQAAHQALLSLGFSRQEHWSGLPFPSPMHESEKWKWSRSVVSDSSRPHGLKPTRLLLPWDFPGKSTGVGCHCLLHFST